MTTTAEWGAAMRRRLKLLNTEELAWTLECSKYAVRQWRADGTGPQFCRLGRRIYYREEDIEAWAHRQSANAENEDVEETEEGETASSQAGRPLPAAVAHR